MDCRTFEDLVAAAADDCLAAEQRQAVEEHLAGCPRCRAALAAQQQVRTLIRRRIAPTRVPDALRRDLLRALDRGRRPARRVWPRRAILAGAIAAALLLAIAPFLRSETPELLAVARRDVAAAETGDLPMAVRTDDVETLRRYYRGAGITFARAVDDLEGEGLHLLGGGVSSIGDTVTTRTVYQGPDGKVICRRFPAGSVAIPAGGAKAGDSRVFIQGGVRVVITPIGDIVCSMASRVPDGPAVAAIAFAHRD